MRLSSFSSPSICCMTRRGSGAQSAPHTGHCGAGLNAADLREFLADKVARWWLPERWAFIEEIPRTSVGKYDKKTIRARYAEGAYDVVTI